MTQSDAKGKQEPTMGRRLAAERALRGLSQEEAAGKAGLTQAYLSKLEGDKATAPPINTISSLAKLYGVSIDYLVYGNAA